MDRFQALAVIGFDGPDSTSPKAEIANEILRLQQSPAAKHPDVLARIGKLQRMEAAATEQGGFRLKP